MRNQSVVLLSAVASISLYAGCGVSPNSPPADGDTSSTRSAAIVGNFLMSDAAKLGATAQVAGCPEVLVSLNGEPVEIEFDEDCSFLINTVEPAENVVLRVELPHLGVSGTIELNDVADDELIEIFVETGDDSLSVGVVRRVTPDPVDGPPDEIVDDDVAILISEGIYAEDLTVLRNNFTLFGEAGDDCDDAAGWSVIEGTVVIRGNSATFRNILFSGSVEVRGNDPTFINCCFGNELIVFGNGVQIDPGETTDLGTPAPCSSDEDCPEGIGCILQNGTDQTGFCDVEETLTP